MSRTETGADAPEARPAAVSFWRELWIKEDYWAIWIGLGVIIVAYLFFASGSNIKWIAVSPPKWSSFDALAGHFIENWQRYAAQFFLWLVVFGVALLSMGRKPAEFIPAFIFLYVLAVASFAAGSWDQSHKYNLEPPLLALAAGLLISNLSGLPRWMDAGFRVEFYIKTGIVLLGATLPLTLIAWAGPVAMLQATIVSVVTFLVIYFTASRLGLDRRLGATLGAGGAVCGVSAAIAVAGAVGAKKEHAPIAITLVVIWAIIMIFVLPLVSRMLLLPAGVAGAWIGTSEFADAAGFAAAQAYGDVVGQVKGISGRPEDAVAAFTLMKVVGRDIWVGLWAFILAIISTTMWEKTETHRKAQAAEIWWRFPKFVIGFAIASVIVTLATSGLTFEEFNKTAKPDLVAPIKGLRSWAFIFCFLSIGLTTRLRELASAGVKPFGAFTMGVAVNVALGFVLSTLVFAGHWANLGR
jgi:uncharacterized integral membrane protein (TIGR00698 family)